MKNFIFIILYSTLCLSTATSETLKPEELFIQGIGSYQKGDFNSAKNAFQQAALSDSNNAVLFYNWGLAEIKLENWGWATALLRKALFLSPGLTSAREALKFINEKSNHPISEARAEGLNFLRNKILYHLPWHLLLALGLFLFMYSSLKLLKFYSKRKIAYQENTPAPSIPIAAVCAFIGALLIVLCLSIKATDFFETKGTLVKSTSQIRSGPNQEDTLLFEVFAGQDLFILNKYQGWLQVKVPGGVTGWLPADNVFLTTESQL